MSLNPFDLFDIRSLLSEEERAVQATVARFTDTRVLPIIGDAFDDGRFPDELIPKSPRSACSAPACPSSTAAAD